jgi:hypothetical protein
MQISGTFSVKMAPLEAYNQSKAGTPLGRMSIDKTFSGDLDAVSKGEMLTAMSPVKGSAGYVAIEKVTGSLTGKQGTFVLQHYGTMDAATGQRLLLEVVPDSGTEGLTGLSGTMQIRIEEGQHFYDFDFELKG